MFLSEVKRLVGKFQLAFLTDALKRNGFVLEGQQY